ncbi:MAG: hypothetical protein U0905_04320 [Pirellulales bacterium]
MSLEGLQNTIQQLPHASSQSIAPLMRRLQKLCESELAMQLYLEQLLPLAVDLFQAQAGMIWLRAHGSHTASFAIRYRMDSVGWNERDLKKHDRILQLAWQQRQPLFVEPQSKRKSAEEEELAFHLVLGPVIHHNEAIALLELLLPAQDSISPDLRRTVLRGMQQLIDVIHDGLQKRLALPVASLRQAEHQITQLEQEIAAYQLSIQRSIEARLRQFQGWSFGSLAENIQFAKRVHKILDEHGLRVRCPECGHPAILRCSSAGNSKNGVFVFDHYLADGRTFHGGPTTFPAITVIPKPARRANLNAS